MAENLTRQILGEHLAEGELRPGSAIALRVDQALLQDATGTMALMQFEQLGVDHFGAEKFRRHGIAANSVLYVVRR